MAVLIPTYVLLVPVRAQESAQKGTIELSTVYAETLVVDAVQYDPKTDIADVAFVNSTGTVYRYLYEGGDINPGEIYNCIMYTNRTPECADDYIMDIKYERIDLLIKGYNDRCNKRQAALTQL